MQLDSVFAEARRAVAPALNGCILTMQSNGLTVQGDADLLCDLVINLVTNAAKASTPGSAIAVCAEQADGSIRLTVQDHGQGIPADKLARVVEPFYMVDKSVPAARAAAAWAWPCAAALPRPTAERLPWKASLAKAPP